MLNSTAVIGRLTYEPELKTTNNGVPVVHITVACDRSYVKQGGERKADFIDVAAYRNTAEFICKYFHKGNMIAIKGRLQTENYTDKQGNKRKYVEVLAEDVSFCESKKKENDIDNVQFDEIL